MAGRRLTSRLPVTRRAVALGALSLAPLALAACDSGTTGLDRRPGAPSSGGVISAPSVQRDSSIVGTWVRRVVILDNSGGISESATAWTFDPGGIGSRLQISRNHTAFLADTAVTLIEWSTSANRVAIEFLPPASGTVDFQYRVNLDTLTLDTQKFVRE